MEEQNELQTLNNNDVQAYGGELTNARIQELEEEDSRLESELADLKGQLQQLCMEHSELPTPQTLFEVAKEVAKEYLDTKGMTVKQAGQALMTALKFGAKRANVYAVLVTVGGMLVMKLRDRAKIIKAHEGLHLQMLEYGNEALAVQRRRVDIAKERLSEMGNEFSLRHEARQQAYDNTVQNAKEESQRQWDSINEVNSDNMDDLLNDLNNI